MWQLTIVEKSVAKETLTYSTCNPPFLLQCNQTAAAPKNVTLRYFLAICYIINYQNACAQHELVICDDFRILEQSFAVERIQKKEEWQARVR